ncbi:PREDICTED: protein FAM76B-like [Amphimedon queenslandica]|uniref:Protein FAM76A n=2 Tax=Amphimedon queenslandica TaxID=400682 RepID=A0AAN0J346_AMPQE|nr:PREDICTED: protein FAM76B-like [Amphimedon queenslandica]|eukprot:XP_019851430.1 PREDICTED: protein FAM76B-like [Amphimedon queenslandica]
MASIDVLYSCSSCHRKYALEELSSAQQLCKDCRRKYPSVQCKFCQLDFHQLDSTAHESVCEQCSKEHRQYGKPKNCSICNLLTAFKGDTCTRCTHSRKKYGPPIKCDTCKLCCAFVKSDESKKKVDGKTLCLLCTLNYKKTMFKKRQRELEKSGISNKKQKIERSEDEHRKVEVVDPFNNEIMQQLEKAQYEIVALQKQTSPRLRKAGRGQ